MALPISRCGDQASKNLADVTEATQLANNCNCLTAPRPLFSTCGLWALQPNHLPSARCCSEGLGLVNEK